MDALTQATTQPVNVASAAKWIGAVLEEAGWQVTLREAVDVKGPGDFLEHDGIIFGTAVWFSNVAYPIKKVFDEHMIRVYEHRTGRLGDKVMGGFVTVMESGQSGPNCLQCLTWMMEHLGAELVDGLVLRTGEGADPARDRAAEFARRFAEARTSRVARP